MLQGVALSLVGFGRYHGTFTGQVFTIMILTVAACEASIALALIVILYNQRSSLDVTLWQDIREADLPATGAAEETDDAEPIEVEPGPESYPQLVPAGVEPCASHATVDREAQLNDFFPSIAWLIPFFPLLGAAIAVLGPGACGPTPTSRSWRVSRWRF